tara:strand:+ start:308 stop:481 length:174 start_codon:yes stop_codon:yes gene_type:complete
LFTERRDFTGFGVDLVQVPVLKGWLVLLAVTYPVEGVHLVLVFDPRDRAVGILETEK